MSDYFILTNDNQNFKEIEVMRGIHLQIYTGGKPQFLCGFPVMGSQINFLNWKTPPF